VRAVVRVPRLHWGTGRQELARDPGVLRAVQHRTARRGRNPDRDRRSMVGPEQARTRMSFQLEPFCDHLALERGLSVRTVDAYRRDLERLAGFMAARGVRRPADVTANELREFVYHLKDLGLQPSSIRRNVSALRTWFAYLLAEGVVVADPTDRVEIPRTWRRLPGVLSRDEVARILDAPDPSDRLFWRDKALLEFAYASGVRVGELITVKVRDIDLVEGLALVFGKGAKERIVPVGRAP